MVQELLAMLNLQPWKQRLQHFPTYRWAFLKQILDVMQAAQVCVLLVVMMLVQVVPDALDAALAVPVALAAGMVVLVAVPGVPVVVLVGVLRHVAVAVWEVAMAAPDALALVTVHVGVRRQAVGRVAHFVPQCVKVQAQTKKEE